MSDDENGSGDLPESISGQSTILLRDLIDRAQVLLSELKAFKLCLETNGASQQVELGYFRKSVESEAKSLDTISKHPSLQQRPRSQDDDATNTAVKPIALNTLHALKSSNLPFYEAVWRTTKSCRGVVSLSKRIALISEKPKPKRRGRGHPKPDKYGVLDIVARNGLEWVKISTVNEKRLLFDIAKEGWATYGDDSDVDSVGEGGPSSTASLSDELELVQLAHHICTAARIYRVRHRHPQVRFVFPKIREGLNSQIDTVLARIRAAGAIVQCASVLDSDDVTTSLTTLHITPNIGFAPLIPTSSTASLTTAINIDCTVLLALISDISHVPRDSIPPYPNNKSGTYHTAILKQIQVEQKHPFVPKELYPILRGRQLVCTSHAADRMHQIVRTMGTTEETLRSYIFFGLNEFSTSSPAQLLGALRSESCHSVPDDLRLPIHIVPFDDLSSAPSLPINASNATVASQPSSMNALPSPQMSHRDYDIAKRISQAKAISNHNPATPHPAAKHTPKSPQSDQTPPPGPFLSHINTSVFLYGWSHALTTVTSNKVIASQLHKRIDDILDYDEQQAARSNSYRSSEEDEMEKGVDQAGTSEDDDDEFTGPNIYVCDTARSLVGKEKQGPPMSQSQTAASEES